MHSPFAFELITKVLRSPHAYYAFFNIPVLLGEQGLDPGLVTPFNHLSFRLVHHFNPRDVLEINSGKGINTLFISSAAPGIQCTRVEADRLPRDGERFDAIFLHMKKGAPTPSVSTLLELGRENSFWVIHPIGKGIGKQFWRKIVNDERISVTFDMKDTGIVFPHSLLTRSRYLI